MKGFFNTLGSSRKPLSKILSKDAVLRSYKGVIAPVLCRTQPQHIVVLNKNAIWRMPCEERRGVCQKGTFLTLCDTLLASHRILIARIALFVTASRRTV